LREGFLQLSWNILKITFYWNWQKEGYNKRSLLSKISINQICK
jgi:hypothetical protein